MNFLSAHHNNPGSRTSIETQCEVFEKYVHVSFKFDYQGANTCENFNFGGYENEGLWDYDVVEVFLQRASGSNHYLELQCSLIGQKFALYIKKPRLETVPVRALNSVITCREEHGHYSVSFKIAVLDIPGDGGEVKGNFFACLGPREARNYYALNINKEESPDFHRPDLFLSLGTL